VSGVCKRGERMVCVCVSAQVHCITSTYNMLVLSVCEVVCVVSFVCWCEYILFSIHTGPSSILARLLATFEYPRLFLFFPPLSSLSFFDSLFLSRGLRGGHFTSLMCDCGNFPKIRGEGEGL